MTMPIDARRAWGATLGPATACLLVAAACGGPPAPGPSDGGGGGDGPLYAVMYEVYDDVGSNSYLALLDSLDGADVDPSTSLEFAGGRAFMQAYDGSIFVGDPSTPVVTRFSVAADGTLSEDGRISFADYGLQAGIIDDWALTFISPTKAYLFDFPQGLHIIWNPSTMEIIGEIPPAPEFLREGFTAEGSPPGVRGNRLFRSIYWVNYDTAEYSQEQILAVYDLDDDTLIETVTETRCPNPGNLVHTDEAGNIYFSNWIWPVAGTLMHGRASNCVLRISPGSERFDAGWRLDYAELSGGHEGAMFSYLEEGRALVSIFDETRTSFDETTDPWAYAGSSNWSLWQVDMEAGSASPVDGIPLNAGAYTPLRFDDRSFVMVPNSEWSETRLYEIEGNAAVPRLAVPGWSYMFVKVR